MKTPGARRSRPSARCLARLEEMSAYLDGELTPARARALEKHMTGCPCCRWLESQLRLTSRLCRDTGVTMPPAERAAARARVRALLRRR
jgi:anti-sigma factor RsiW